VTAGIVGTGAGLLTGQKLSDAVKSGLTAGAVSGLTTGIQKGIMGDIPGTPARTDLPPVEDRFLPSSLQQQGALTPAAAAAGAPAPVLSSIDTRALENGIGGIGVAAPPVAGAAAPVDPRALENGIRFTPAPVRPAGIGESIMKTAGGLGDLLQGKPGAFETVKTGAAELFAPKTYSASELMNSDVYREAVKTMTPAEAMKLARAEYNPSIVREYGPMAAAGLGVAGLMGCFSPSKVPPSALAQQMRGTPGLDLINRNPSQYLVQGLPGVQYGAQGNITGSGAWSPTASMSDVQAATPDYTGGIFNYNPYSRNYFAAADGGLASLAQGGYPRKTGAISGPGTETSDSIPAMLSDGEFVMTAKAVKGLGKGSRREGAKKMYALMHQLERNASRG
jgi:hypothetical protein